MTPNRAWVFGQALSHQVSSEFRDFVHEIFFVIDDSFTFNHDTGVTIMEKSETQGARFSYHGGSKPIDNRLIAYMVGLEVGILRQTFIKNQLF